MGGVKITMLLADAAQQVGGKLYILGGGWSTTGSPTAPMAVAIKIEVPWDRTNVSHDWRLALVDADGRPVQTSDDRAVEVSGQLEVGRPAGLAGRHPARRTPRGQLRLDAAAAPDATSGGWRSRSSSRRARSWSAADLIPVRALAGYSRRPVPTPSCRSADPKDPSRTMSRRVAQTQEGPSN